MAIAMLCEGSSIRAIERITGIHRDTIMRLGVRVGEACVKIHDAKMINMNCRRIGGSEFRVLQFLQDSQCYPHDSRAGGRRGK